MQINPIDNHVKALFREVLEPLIKYNPFFTLYYNPLIGKPQVVTKPYSNYIHQISLLLDAMPRGRVRILIGDEVGLGKTVEAIRILKYLITIGRVKKALIIAPRILIKQWLHHDLKELLYAPGYFKVVSRSNIKELVEKGVDPNKVSIFLAPIDLVKRGSMDKHRYGAFRPYYDFVSSVEWDLIIVDEAHQLGFLKRGAPLRTERLAPLCRNAENLLLLSATPSRGLHRDVIGRVSLLIPTIKDRIDEYVDNVEARSRLYRVLSDYVIYRRTKDYVNKLENKRVFSNLSSLLAVVKLGDKASLYEDLNLVLTDVLKRIRGGASSLIKVIVLKRALSSPYAFLKTLNKVINSVESTGGFIEIKSPPPDIVIERKVDEILESILRRIELPSEIRVKVTKLLSEFEKIYSEGDPAFKALAHLLLYVVQEPQSLPVVLIGDYVVFSEYYDTVEYVYSKLIEFFLANGFVVDDDLLEKVFQKTLRKLLEERGVGSFDKYINTLRNSVKLMRSLSVDKWVFVAKVSSRNINVVYLLPDLIEELDCETGGRVLKVLLSTDVASEGLNLHQFNIVVNYDTPWSPVRREQRLGRVYRLRQRRDCCVIDFVRDVKVDYEFYTKLVLKLLNMVEQRIYSKPLEGVIELYVVEKKENGGVGGTLLISEKDLYTALCSVYEEYYGNRRGLSGVLDETRIKLNRFLVEYRSLVEELTPSSSTIESLRNYVRDLTGCGSEECFKDTLCKTYEVLLKKPCDKDLSEIILELFEELFSDRSVELYSNSAIVLNDPSVEKGYFSVVEFTLNGEVRYSTPILVLFRNGSLMVTHGLESLSLLVDYARRGGLRVIKLPQGVSDGDFVEFERIVKLFLNRINHWFNERMGLKDKELIVLTNSRSPLHLELSFRINAPLIRVLGVQGLDDYEAFRSKLPAEVREWMEVESVNCIQDLFRNMGCRVLEVNVGIRKPYDLLVECPSDGGFTRFMVEVKSHLKRVLVAELTPSETELAEENPRNYIVCNVSGLENRDKSSWIIICKLYEEATKELVTKMKEEKVARIYFS